MSDLATWQEENAHYLTVAINWLRLRLQRMIPDATVTTEEIASAQTEMLAAEAMEPPPALITLSARLGLSEFEQSLLLLCAAMELDTEITSFCAQIQGESQRYPTFALALGLFDDPVWDIVSPERPLRNWRLIEIHQSGVQPLTVSPIKADERIVNYLKGLNFLDDRLKALVAPLPIPQESSEPWLAPSQQQVVTSIIRQLDALPHGQRPPLIQLLGSDRTSKQAIAVAVADEFYLPIYRIRLELLPTQSSELETIMRLWQRELRLFPVALYLDGQGLEAGNNGERSAALLHTFLDSLHAVFFIEVQGHSLPLDQPTLSFEVAKPTPIEQQQAWQQVTDEHQIAALLSGQFSLNLTDIEQIGATLENARALSEAPEMDLTTQLWDTCLLRTRPQLDALAQRLETKATWQDLVLPETETAMLRQIAAQVQYRSQVYDDWGFRDRMNRGLGVNALFAGESGTGKTMAAEVIANELRLNLYRIDLSSVVSKYIGETEKNLRRLFDAAEDGGAILFFDEADALFGKRSAVKDSHDRYANIEVNYLLQRIETYRGLAILATNLKGSMDSAFMRRLRFVINFPFPSVESRQEMWQKVFPAQTPVAELDYQHLGGFNLTGGSIHNIAINAAFEAAQAGGPVGMLHILSATRAEFRKLDLPIYEGDFK